MALVEINYSLGANSSCRSRLVVPSGQSGEQRCDDTGDDEDGNLISGLIRSSKRHRWLTWMLALALAISALNIVLLSFLVKSVQLNEKGFRLGRVAWDRRTGETSLELFTRLVPSKSISLESIEASGALNLGVGGRASGETPMRHLFLRQEVATNGQLSLEPPRSNYMAAVAVDGAVVGAKDDNNNNNKEEQMVTLEIGAGKKFMLAKLMATNSSESRPLLELDARLSSISLAQLDHLPLDSRQTSLLVGGQLASPEIIGSLGENLDIQTRQSDLNCRAEQKLELISRSGHLHATAFDTMLLEAPALLLKPAKHLYLSYGLQYFDQEPSLSTSFLLDFDGADALRAYNLVTINGLLTASV